MDRTIKIAGRNVTQVRMPFSVAADLGMFKQEVYPDWSLRAAARPRDEVWVYYLGRGDKKQVLGYVDGEGASFDTLGDWLELPY